MSYRTPTPTELRISKKLPKVADQIQKWLRKQKIQDTHFFLFVTPNTPVDESRTLEHQPVAGYISNANREDMAKTMLTMMMRWEIEGAIPPLHEIAEYVADKEKRTNPDSKH